MAIFCSIRSRECLRSYIDKAGLQSSLMDKCGDITAACVSPLIEVLLKALEKRVKLVAIKPLHNSAVCQNNKMFIIILKKL